MAKKTKELAQGSALMYSDQALNYIELLSDFDLQEFETWFRVNVVVGGGDIMNFLTQKKNG